MREEFGDLLLQIMLNSQIAAEAGDFTLNDVTRAIHDKLIRRHPHVFGGLDIGDVDGILSNWERLKEGERAQEGRASGLLGGVPVALPALSQAQEYQDRAARVGFDWPRIDGVLEKISEEVQEVRATTDAEALEAELGDLLFSLVNLSRWKRVDAESALRVPQISASSVASNSWREQPRTRVVVSLSFHSRTWTSFGIRPRERTFLVLTVPEAPSWREGQCVACCGHIARILGARYSASARCAPGFRCSGVSAKAPSGNRSHRSM
jgi:NTP pyrophosphatase (non-canonical NTP hydrolase)